MTCGNTRCRHGYLRGAPIVLACSLLALLLLPAPSSAAGQGEPERESDTWEVKWDKGFRVDSPDGDFKLRFGGFFQADFTFVGSADDAVEARFGPLEDGSEFRRARLFFSGTLYGNLEFKAEYDFAGGDPDFKDVYLEFLDTPVGNLRLGHFKEPFSIELLTSDKYTPFLERALPLILGPDRNMGLMLHDHVGDTLNWGVGVFRSSDDFGFSSGDDLINLTGRVAWRPLYQEAGRRLVQIGLSATDKDTAGLGDEFRIRERPEGHILPPMVDTGGFSTDGEQVLDFEVAAVFGRFWFGGEYLDAEVDTPDRGTLSFGGGYVQAGYFLTGEHRPFDTADGRFEGVKPKRNFERGGGIGAWEVAVRLSTLDLTDATILGGELDTMTLGLNWYPNPATRMMLDWVHSDLDPTGEADFFLVRGQVEF